MSTIFNTLTYNLVPFSSTDWEMNRIFMLATMLDSKASGLYGLALNLTYVFSILIGSLNAVLLPEVSRYREIAQIERYVKNSLKISIGISLTILPSVVRLRICVVIIFRMFFEIMLSKVSEVKISSLIVNLDSQFPDSFDRNFFSEIIVTVDC